MMFFTRAKTRNRGYMIKLNAFCSIIMLQQLILNWRVSLVVGARDSWPFFHVDSSSFMIADQIIENTAGRRNSRAYGCRKCHVP